MFKSSLIHLTLITAAMFAVTAANAETMTKASYKSTKERISADAKTDKAACSSMAGNAKDICVQEAKAKDKVALAELEFAYTGKAADRTKIQVVKADTAYAVAKERCDDLTGNAKDVCVKEAKAVQTKAQADAKLGKEIGAARKDATADKLDADYKVAIEKCGALAGDAKTRCVDSAKQSFGKT
jgi:hypothetical protein